MAKPKLIQALQGLSAQETQTARKTIKLKYSSKRPDIYKLFELLNSPFVDKPKEFLWKKLYGSKTSFNDLKWRTLTMQLNAELIPIIKNSYLENYDPAIESLIKIKAFSLKKLNKHLESSWTDYDKIYNSPRHCDHYYYFSKIHEIKLLNSISKRDKNIKFESLEDSDRFIEIYYRSQKLKNACYSIANQITNKIDLGLNDEFVIESINKYGNVSNLIHLYGSIILLFAEKDAFTLDLCQELFLDYVNSLHKEEGLNILTLLMNYCIDSKINKGQLEYFHNLFELYKLGIQKMILFEKDVLNPMHYKNIITVGLNTKNYTWTKLFIEEYTCKIPIEEQENAYNFNMAKVLFQQEAYEEVLNLLNTVEYNNMQYMLGTKLILAKTYYEIEEEQALEALIESFRVLLIRTTKISKDLKKQYNKFLKFLKKLVYINPYDQSELAKLKNQLENEKGIVGRTWLIEKLELKNKKA